MRIAAEARRYWSGHVSARVYRWTYTRLAHQLDSDLFAWLGERTHGATVVDCGCGPGVVTAKLLERGARTVYAVDVNASMLGQTARRLDRAQRRRVVLLREVVDEAFWQRWAALSGGSACDLILWKRSLYAPRHMALATLRAAVGQLAPGGALVVIHAERSVLRHCFGPGLRLRAYTAYHLLNRAASVLGAALGVGDYALYSRDELFELLRDAAAGERVEAIPSAQRAFNLGAIVCEGDRETGRQGDRERSGVWVS